MLIDLGSGVKARSMGTFGDHLSLEGERSPFVVLCKKLDKAVSADAKAKSKTLSRKTEDIMRDIYRQFDDMVDQKIDDDSEDELRRQFREFLQKEEPVFEDLKADLAKVKKKYES